MPPKTVKGDDGRDYIELPGGVRFPADELKEPQPSTGNKIATQAYKILNPEVLGGLAGLAAPETGGLSLAIPPIVGAATSVGRDLWAGERNPKTIASDALLHGFTNLIPGGVGRLVKGAGMVKGAALDAASMIPKVGYAAKIAKMMGMGGAEAAAPAAKATSDLAGATLPFGEKVLSKEGLDYLMNESKALAMKGKAFGDPQYDALAELIDQVKAHLTANPSGSSLAQRAMIPLTSAAQRGAATATKYGRSTANGLRALLGLGSTTYEEAK